MFWFLAVIVLVAIAGCALAVARAPVRRAKRWAASRGLRPAFEVPAPLANTTVHFTVRWAASSPGLALAQIAVPPIPGRRLYRRLSGRPAMHAVLLVRREHAGGPSEFLALRPTGRPTSLVDLYALGYARSDPLLSFPSVIVPEAFVPFAAQNADPALFPLLPQVPPDVGLLLTPGWLILDLAPRHLAPGPLEKLSALSPLIPAPSPPMISPR